MNIFCISSSHQQNKIYQFRDYIRQAAFFRELWWGNVKLFDGGFGEGVAALRTLKTIITGLMVFGLRE